jgi:hypothetical protein
VISEPSDCEKIGRTVKLDAVFECEALASKNLVGYRPQLGVGENQFAQRLSAFSGLG